MNQTIDQVDSSVVVGRPHNCILFNDESHGMDEVAAQIIKAVHCGAQRAVEIMMEAHLRGRAIVLTASLERCELAANVLEEIRLGTTIESA